MPDLVARNKQFLTDLFAGPFRGHGLIMDPDTPPSGMRGDLSTGEHPLTLWRDYWLRDYEVQVTRLEALGDDTVPTALVGTGTQIFAAAFGCPVHIYDDSPPAALPLVTTAAEADALAVPAVDAGPLGRCWQVAGALRDQLGPGVPIRVPDIQSPFDIAALIWKKEAFYMALLDDPNAVRRLVGKCQELLTSFLKAWREEFGEVSYAHCPRAWAPPGLGCWLSEDEAGALSVGMFEGFCLPVLSSLSEEFGGLFVHCCATADHQYDSFRKVPNLRGLNRVFQAPGPQPAIEAFAGETVLMMAWVPENQVEEMLAMALPETRFLFNMGAQPLEDAKRTFERLREGCPR